MKKWIITKGGKTFCVTTVQYPPNVEKEIKKAGYKIRETEVSDNGANNKPKTK